MHESTSSYRGLHPLFDRSTVRRYPLSERSSKVEVDDFIVPADILKASCGPPAYPWARDGSPGTGEDQSAGLDEIAGHAVACARAGKPVILFAGAHFIKNGFAPLVIDLIDRGIVTAFSGNGACAIHSFEFALTGSSSESVRDALPSGAFGMAFETGAYLNTAIEVGTARGIGFGEAMGRLYRDADFRREVLDLVFSRNRSDDRYLMPYDGFPYAESCLFARGYDRGIPLCIHATPGTDIIDQHPEFDGRYKGLACGYDFLILAEVVRRCAGGGMFINLGSAVTGPEVALKACSMAANVGFPPRGLWTADFDLRPFGYGEDESVYHYYLRDQKSMATRIPRAFGGHGYYFQGPHRETLTAFYRSVIDHLEA